jgi:hypothetical protein
MHFSFTPGNWIIEGGEQWTQFLRPGAWNWLDVRLAHLSFEWYRSMGMIEMQVALLGFDLRLAYVYNQKTEDRLTVTQRMDDFLANTSVVVPGARYDELKAKAELWDQHVKEASNGPS